MPVGHIQTENKDFCSWRYLTQKLIYLWMYLFISAAPTVRNLPWQIGANKCGCPGCPLCTHTCIYPDVWNTFFFYQRVNELLCEFWHTRRGELFHMWNNWEGKPNLLPSGFLPSASYCWTWDCSTDSAGLPAERDLCICSPFLDILSVQPRWRFRPSFAPKDPAKPSTAELRQYCTERMLST